jgi:hypothetical protein
VPTIINTWYRIDDASDQSVHRIAFLSQTAMIMVHQIFDCDRPQQPIVTEFSSQIFRRHTAARMIKSQKKND